MNLSPQLIDGLTPIVYWAKIASSIESALIEKAFAQSVDGLDEIEDADAEMEDDEFFIPQIATQQEKVLYCVQHGMKTSDEISGILKLPLKTVSAYLSFLTSRGFIEKFSAQYLSGGGRSAHKFGGGGRATHFYRPCREN